MEPQSQVSVVLTCFDVPILTFEKASTTSLIDYRMAMDASRPISQVALRCISVCSVILVEDSMIQYDALRRTSSGFLMVRRGNADASSVVTTKHLLDLPVQETGLIRLTGQPPSISRLVNERKDDSHSHSSTHARIL